MKDLKQEFAKIYDQYVDKIYRFVLLKVNSVEIAEDLTAETFKRGWAVFQANTEPIANIRAFLYQISRNLVVDHYRSKAKTSSMSLDQLTDNQIGVESRVVLDSDLDSVMKIIHQLNRNYQDVLIWRYVDDLSNKEISRLLGKSEGATRVLISRALAELKKRAEKIKSA